MSEVKWWKVRDLSLALAARAAGYDLTMYDDYPDETRAALRKSAIKNVMIDIQNEFEELTDRTLGSVKQGVYLICLSWPFTVGYEDGNSEIIYIGRGNICTRLKSHFEGSLFRFMRSLAGSNFDFYLTEPVSKVGPDYYKHIEYMLLENFREKIGGGEYPLLNTNAGSKKDFDDVGAGWNKPLKASGKKPIWTISPTQHWDIENLD